MGENTIIINATHKNTRGVGGGDGRAEAGETATAICGQTRERTRETQFSRERMNLPSQAWAGRRAGGPAGWQVGGSGLAERLL